MKRPMGKANGSMPQQPEPASSHEPRIQVNGEEQPICENCTVRQLLDTLGMGGRRVAVAINRQVVPRSDHDSTVLRADDRVEILEAVGGG